MTVQSFKCYEHPDLNRPITVRGELVITSVRVIESHSHDEVHVWNRGGKSGVLAVTKGDGHSVAKLLLPEHETWVSR